MGTNMKLWFFKILRLEVALSAQNFKISFR